MSLAKKACLFILGLALTAPILGCGVGSTPAENRRMVMRAADYDARMMVDDLGVLIQTDHPLRTSRYNID